MAVGPGLGLTLSQITYIGDSETDSETAARAGARFGLFTEGYRQTARKTCITSSGSTITAPCPTI